MIGASINEFSTDGTFSQNSDSKVPTQKAVKTYTGTIPSITPSTGTLVINGHTEPASDGVKNLGSPMKRWANIYAADMHYSNEGDKNSVDGTWGSYTIQEGENDLFLLNNRNGKKYKFNLTEVN